MAPPTVVRVGYWMAVASATVVLIGAVLALSAKQTMVDAQIARPGQTLTPDQIRDAINLQVWLLLGFSLVLGLLVALFARKVLAAERKARVRFTIVTLLLVLFLFFFGNLIGLVGGLFLLVSMALLFMPTATRYLTSE